MVIQLQRVVVVIAVVIATTLCVLACAMPEPSRVKADDGFSEHIASLTACAADCSTSDTRLDAAVALTNFLCDLGEEDKRRVTEDTVEKIAELLNEKNFAYQAAAALGCIGPAAATARPALERVLARTQTQKSRPFVIQPDFQLEYAVQSALRRIGAR